MHRHQFEAYLDKVFDSSDRVAALPEGLHQDPGPLFALGCDLARRLKRNSLMHSEWAREYRNCPSSSPDSRGARRRGPWTIKYCASAIMMAA